MTDDGLAMWTVYHNTSDYPGLYVVRRLVLEPGGGMVKDVQPSYVGASLDEARDAIPPGLYRQDRNPNDDPVIVEVWF